MGELFTLDAVFLVGDLLDHMSGIKEACNNSDVCLNCYGSTDCQALEREGGEQSCNHPMGTSKEQCRHLVTDRAKYRQVCLKDPVCRKKRRNGAVYEVSGSGGGR